MAKISKVKNCQTRWRFPKPLLLCGLVTFFVIFALSFHRLEKTQAQVGEVQPVGASGSWMLVFQDEFEGTSLDTTKWDPYWYCEGCVQNRTATFSTNVAVADGNLILTRNGVNSGASVNTQSNNGFEVQVGMYAESRIYFPGNGANLYNWPAWWISAYPHPQGGEHDIAEVLDGKLTINYHSPTGAHNFGAVPGYWGDAFHTYGIHRKADSADVYWDGQLVKSYNTDDNGDGEHLIFNIGADNDGFGIYGIASQVKVDYVRVWKPCAVNCPEITEAPKNENPSILIPTTAIWQYLDNNTRPIGWETLFFDDAAWQSGPAELGYGDGDEATVVSYGGNSSNKFPTTYFRHTFNVNNPAAYTDLIMNLKRDDGAVVYLNGQEVFRTNMPPGILTHTTYAANSIEDNTYHTVSVPVTHLRPQKNVVAVEIHQSDASSSDISMSLSLKGTVITSAEPTSSLPAIPINVPTSTNTPTPISSDTKAPTVSITSPADGSSLARRSKFRITASASDESSISKVEFYVDGRLKCTDTSAAYSCIWRIPNTRGVTYTLTAKAFDTRGNFATSSPVRVTPINRFER